MSKNREVKRRRKMQKKRCRAQAAPKRQPVHRENSAVPSAQTMWRTMHLNFRVQETLIATTMDLQPSLWKRDANKIHRIEQAIGLEAVLDLAPSASGLAEYAWLKRLLGFGSRVAPAIVARLKTERFRRGAKRSAVIYCAAGSGCGRKHRADNPCGRKRERSGSAQLTDSNSKNLRAKTQSAVGLRGETSPDNARL